MNLNAYFETPAGCSVSTAIPTLDVETFSKAGYIFNNKKERYQSLVSNKPGIKGVGAAVYAQDPTTEILMLSYDLFDGVGSRSWVQGMQPPQELFDYIAGGGLLESFNAGFEFLIWHYVCFKRMNWPPLPLEQQRCAQAKARAYAAPGQLGKLAEVLGTKTQKDKEGKRLIRKFSIPRSPTKKDKRQRIRLEDDPKDADNFIFYNIGDIETEAEASLLCPDLSADELEVWIASQRINLRGVHIDVETLEHFLELYRQTEIKYTRELVRLTCGRVGTVNEYEKLREYIADYGINLPNVQAETIKDALKRSDLPFNVRRVLLIRQWLSMASVKKLQAIDVQRCDDNRLRDLFGYHVARTGRWAGSKVQPHNLATSGPAVDRCGNCGHYQATGAAVCKWCRSSEMAPAPWNLDAVEDVILISSGRDVDLLEHYFENSLKAMSGCMRALFTAAPGRDLICSDFSAIEAVVLAELAGEKWRQDVFRSHGKIYEMSAAKITGIPFQEFLDYKERTGESHPLRKKIGKVAELASGYQGWIGAWRAFGADKHFKNDDEIKDAILKWREDSPAIVEFWGDQWREMPGFRNYKQEYYGLEGAAVCAVLNPGKAYACRSITYGVKDDTLYCRLPSGRLITYHAPRLFSTTHRYHKNPIYQLSFMGWNSDSTKGPIGWIRMETYGGKLCENVTQAVARDILAYALVNAEKAGYPIVLHVHDELAAEVPAGSGSVEELEQIMGTVPAWAKGWPIKAAGGWRGRRYRKD